MPSQIQGTTRPVVQTNQRAPQVAVVAREGNYGGPAPAGNADLRGLVEGLAVFNPAISQWMQSSDMQRQAEELRQSAADKQGMKDAHQRGEGAAAMLPQDALSGAPLEVPPDLPPAYGPEFLRGMRTGVAQRLGLQNKQDAAAEFQERMQDPAFLAQAPQWLSEHRQKALAGITDPAQQEIIGKHYDELGVEVAGAIRRETGQRRDAAVHANGSALTRGFFTPDMGPAKMAEALPSFYAQMDGMGLRKPEATKMLVRHLTDLSTKMGGNPSLFDVLDARGPDGLAPVDHIAEMGPEVRAAREHASALAKRAAADAAAPLRAKMRMSFEDRAMQDPFSVSDDEVYAAIGVGKAFESDNEGVSFLASLHKARVAATAAKALEGTISSGTLGSLKPEDQQRVLESSLAPALRALWSDPSAPNAALAGRAIMDIHSSSGASVPVASMERWVKTTVTNMPNAGGPPPRFDAVVEVFKSLQATPQYRDLYFDEKTSLVLGAYVAGVEAGDDPKAAYMNAYQSADPARVKAARDRIGTPEFKKLVQKAAEKEVQGSWLFSRPEATFAVQSELSFEMESYFKRNPTATEDQAAEHLKGFAARNYVLDETSKTPVRVPPGMAGPQTQQVITEYTRGIAEKLNLKRADKPIWTAVGDYFMGGDRADAPWVVQLVHQGGGVYTPTAFSGTASKVLDSFRLEDLLRADAEKRIFTPAERAEMAAYKAGKGGLAPELVHKASSLGLLTPAEVTKLNQDTLARIKARVDSIPKMSLGDKADALLQPRVRTGSGVDNRVTAQAALEALNMGGYASHQTLAASLVMLGEGLAPVAYKDPAAKAGMNIGAGYNLNANADRVDADLKAAGVDPSAIQAVKEGRASLTPAQAARLTMVALPRYERQARDVAEGTQKGLWGRMTPHQKAVMTDIAYQVGDPSQFKKAWAALAANDTAAFQEAAKVFYTDHSGNRVEDKRRGGLRAAMLAGDADWMATIQKHGSYPSSRLQSPK